MRFWDFFSRNQTYLQTMLLWYLHLCVIYKVCDIWAGRRDGRTKKEVQRRKCLCIARRLLFLVTSLSASNLIVFVVLLFVVFVFVLFFSSLISFFFMKRQKGCNVWHQKHADSTHAFLSLFTQKIDQCLLRPSLHVLFRRRHLLFFVVKMQSLHPVSHERTNNYGRHVLRVFSLSHSNDDFFISKMNIMLQQNLERNQANKLTVEMTHQCSLCQSRHENPPLFTLIKY